MNLLFAFFRCVRGKKTRKFPGRIFTSGAKALGITDRTLRSFKNNQHPVSVDDLLNMAKLYKTDVMEFILENYVEEKEEQILCNRYGSFLKTV